MTPRERLADWISGGAVRRAQEAAKRECAAYEKEWSERYMTILLNHEAERNGVERQVRAECEHVSARLGFCIATLELIAKCETANANATVRRMAKMARDAL